jgi:hypothetical protein
VEPCKKANTARGGASDNISTGEYSSIAICQKQIDADKAASSHVGAHEYKSLPKDVLLAKLDSLHREATVEMQSKRHHWEQVRSAVKCGAAFKATWGLALVEQDVFVGLVIKKDPPHTVISVDNVIDKNYVAQGMPGYANLHVMPGDRLVAVDGQKCYSECFAIHDLLKGEPNTIVELTLARGNDAFTIEVMRQPRKNNDCGESVTAGVSDSLSSNPGSVSCQQNSKSTGSEEGENNSRIRTVQQQEPGYVGLQLTKNAPFLVSGVRNIMDCNYVRQGVQGYSNEEVLSGDTIIAVDGRVCTNSNLATLHMLLKGFAHTQVELTLSRKDTGAVYTIQVMRHPADATDLQTSSTPQGAARTSQVTKIGGITIEFARIGILCLASLLWITLLTKGTVCVTCKIQTCSTLAS